MSGQPEPKFQLEFLDYIQRLLDGGGFVATYKFALLMALADLSVEKGDDSDDPLPLHVDDIAKKFIQYYARQTVPYPATADEKILHQNTGNQAKIINLVAQAQAPYVAKGTPVPLANLTGSKSLVREVAGTVATMPLWKLQVINGKDDEFLYPQSRMGRSIELKPGIAFCFRRFHGFVTRLAQDGWIRHVREVGENRDILGGQADLAAFLFGTPRAPLASYRPILREIQGGRCFYCGVDRRETDVDHFIPWSWYSLDLGHNFVLACKPCNSYKRDSLAAVRHLENWARRNADHGPDLAQTFHEHGLPHDLGATRTVAIWAYRRTEAVQGATWVRAQETESLHGNWAALLG
jgi:5-methylcytosine-specific restriction endonuclease McrA